VTHSWPEAIVFLGFALVLCAINSACAMVTAKGAPR